MTRFSRMSLASSTSTASHELTSPELYSSITSTAYFTLPQQSDDAGREHPSAALNGRNVGNDASYSLPALPSASVAQVASYGLAEGSAVVDQASAHSAVGVTFPVANPSWAYPQAGQTSMASNICYSCNTSCKNPTTLAKHQNEFCERKVEWVCPSCPQKVFGLQERLNRHHMEAHADPCPYGC